MRFRPFVFAISLLLPAPVLGQDAPPSVLSLNEIEVLSAADPAAAIAAIDLTLSQISPDRIRELFDLFLRKAELTAAQGNAVEAAGIYVELAQFVAARRGVLDRDPVVLLERSADLYQQAGDVDAVINVVTQILEEQRDGGRDKTVLAATWMRLSNLAGDIGNTAQADVYANASKEALSTPEDATRNVGDEGGFREVEVFYATDRARTGSSAPSDYYGYERGELETGIAIVTIPDTHELGVLEAPSIWRLEFGPNAAKHVVLRSLEPVDGDEFFTAMNTRLDETGAESAFVFIHGYNVRFEAAAKRAAQMSHDINFAGIPILYSWPSRGSTIGYIADTAVVRLSGRRLSRFLDDVIDKSGAQTIHIVAHSMGNRALTDALELLALRRGLAAGSEPVFEQVLFAAPDVDADLFAEMLPTIRPVARRLTLYASEQDWALETSRQLHGDSPRAGQGGTFTLADENIDSVDMSELGEDMLAHSYFADDRSALADIVALFWRNAAPNQRCGLAPVTGESPMVPIWLYQVGQCEDRKLVEVLSHMEQAKVNDMDAANRVLEETVTDPQTAKAIAPVVEKLLGN